MAEIFLSYKREPASHHVASRVKTYLEAELGATVVWDESGIDTGGDIRAYMDRLAQGTNIVFVISAEFLRSPYCMYEVAKTASFEGFKERAFALLLDGVRLGDHEVFSVVEHWAEEWDQMQRRVDGLRAKNPRLVTPKIEERLAVLEGIAVGASDALFNLAEKKWLNVDGNGELEWSRLRDFVGRWMRSAPSKTTPPKPEVQVSSTAAATQTAPVTPQGSRLPAPIQRLLDDLVLVEGGSFMMGDDHGPNDDEKPAHEVTVGNFRMGKYPVTQLQWRTLMGSDPEDLHFKRRDENPVEGVNWHDCQEFLKRLTALTGNRFRLPTEAEWEYAARGGRNSRGYRYSGANDIDRVAWYYGKSAGVTHPVGQKAANELGLHDMSGNVWEWCLDWYAKDYYAKSPKSAPHGPAHGSLQVLRGGSWGSVSEGCRVTSRHKAKSGDEGFDIGFRVVMG